MALSQEDINDINALIASYINDNKTKVSTLPEAQSLTGLWILGVSAGASVRASMALLKGLDGKNPELRNTGIELQWRLEGGTWAKLADIADIRGFKQMLQKTSTEIQSKYENEQQWQTLLTLSELKGDKGDKGDKGETGSQGIQGEKGDTGAQGIQGVQGEKGDKGDTGAKGDKGDKGDPGDQGLQGLPGADGHTPIKGVDYFDGAKGDKGDKGDKGEKGDTGEQGIQGEKGDKGDTGAKGDKGDKGDTGQGLPAGGSAGQQLVKKSGTDYDYDWQTPAGAGDMLKSVYDPSGKNTDVFGYVDNKVKTDVPVGAKFTDTTYTEITEAEIDTGTASTLRTITARRITYILNKAQALINSAISALTKSSVGLGNVDNIQQASKTEFDTHNSDSTRHITSSERTAWNAKGSSNLALGETSATAYRGDRGKIAYDHSQASHAPANAQKNSDITKAEIEAKLTGVITTHSHTVTKANVGLGNVDNTSDADKPVSTAMQTALNDKLDANKMQVVASLPASPVSGVFYFVKE